MKVLKILFVASVALLSLNNIFAQGGSNYSCIGLGDIMRSGGAAYQGMGGAMAATPSEFSINPANPALWTYVKSTRLQVGYNFNQQINKSGNNTIYQNNGGITGVQTLFAIDTAMGLAVSAGIQPYSRSAFLVSNTFSTGEGESLVTGKNTYKGSGGALTGYFGAACMPLEHLSLGAQVETNFGSLKSDVYTTIDGTGYSTYEVLKEDNFSGVGFKIGAYYDGIDHLGLGVYYQASQKTDVTSNQTHYYNVSGISDTVVTTNFSMKTPSTLGFGASYLTGKFLVSGEMSLLNTGNLDYNYALEGSFKNSTKYSLGVARVASQNRTADYADKVTYKFGLSYQDLYYTIRNTKITDLSASFGFQAPVSSAGTLDAAIVVGTRGTTDNGLIKETYVKLFFEISFGETWFKPYKRQY